MRGEDYDVGVQQKGAESEITFRPLFGYPYGLIEIITLPQSLPEREGDLHTLRCRTECLPLLFDSFCKKCISYSNGNEYF